jgi:enterochelin esterase-like enzyme
MRGAVALVLTVCAATNASGASAANEQASAVGAGDPVAMEGPSPGRFVLHDDIPSRHIAARRVVVWLPEGYDASTERYAVLYMHDGQNLFDPATSMGGEPWAVDRHLDALSRAGRVRPTIVVGVWSTGDRTREYAPAAPLRTLPAALLNTAGLAVDSILSDAYIGFLISDLKPYIDATYRTLPHREDTFVMGSSMGGLISLYALAKRPDVFGGAGCLSTHWPITVGPDLLTVPGEPRVDRLAQAYLDWLRATLPPPGAHRLYFDHGTEHLDSLYGPFQQRMDRVLGDLDHREGIDFTSRVFAGATHDERSWRARLDVPLEFLLRP